VTVKKVKVVIYVEGGAVQEVYGTSNDVDVSLVDFDVLEEQGKDSSQRDKILKKATKGLVPVPY
jgi:hypothetical protein